METEKRYTYDVFISYKHDEIDSRIAGKIHKKLERYRLAKEIQKKTQKKKISRVFRDKEELAAGPDLSKEIRQQLEKSEFLVIICSRESKKSEWVNRELEMFLETHDIDHVIPVILNGEPKEVYPERLQEEAEPFAVDVRGKNPKEQLKKVDSEFYRLLAPILYCSYDELVQRQKRYQMQQWGIMASITALIMMLFLGMALYEIIRTKEAYQEQLLSESRLLTEKAKSYLDKGDTIKGVEYLLQALPNEESKRESWPEAQYLLTDTLGIYGKKSWGSAYKITRRQDKIRDYGEVELVSSSSGQYIYTRNCNVLNVWDADSLCLHTAIKPEDAYISRLKDTYSVEEDQIIFFTEYYIYRYDTINGKEIWRLRLLNRT